MNPRRRRQRRIGAWRRALARGARARSGLTLIEAMFAMAILAIGLLSLFALHQASITASQLSYRTSQATILAEDMMQQLIHRQYNRGNTPGPWAGHPADPTTGTDPLADLQLHFPSDADGNCQDPAQLVDALAGGGGAGGAPMFCRTYHITELDSTTDGSGRIMITARVTFQMSETGKKHGVTLIETRSFDQYD